MVWITSLAGVAIGIACVGGFGMNFYLRYAYGKKIGTVMALDKISRTFSDVTISFRGFLLNPDDDTEWEVTQATIERLHELIIEAKKISDDRQVIDTLEKMASLDKEQLQKLEREVASTIKTDQKRARSEYLEKCVPIFANVEDLLISARKITLDIADKYRNWQAWSMYATAFILVGICAFAIFLIIRYTRSLTNSVTQQLGMVSTALKRGATSVQTASGDLATMSQRLTNSTQENTSAIQGTIVNMETFRNALIQTVQHVYAGLKLSTDGRNHSDHARQVLQRMVGAMDEIQTFNGKLESLIGLIQKIRERTGVIHSIVFQTKILSFNASIEAAIAGERGAGFAVVAEEVGKLAATTGEAAVEIHALLESSVAEVTGVVRGTQERVNTGKGISQECQQAFDAVTKALESISKSLEVVKSATEEQDRGVQQTDAAMNRMSDTTEQTVENAASLAQEATGLSKDAKVLMSTVRNLQLVVEGSKSQKNFGAVTPAERRSRPKRPAA